jgi:hypothetical protein
MHICIILCNGGDKIMKLAELLDEKIYESKTIKDCEQKFREAVLGYKNIKDMYVNGDLDTQ